MSSLVLRITPSSTIPLLALGGTSPGQGKQGLITNNRPNTTLVSLANYLRGLLAGGSTSLTSALASTSTSIRCDVNPVAATGTITLSTSSGAIAAVINGVTITSTLSSGDTLNAAALAAAINASTDALVVGLVTATSAAAGADAIVTITALPGKMGNAVTTAATGTGATADQVRLTGGTDGTAQVTAAKASGTFTFATASGSCVAFINGQTVTITATGTDADDAVLMATAILASEKVGIRGVVTATSALGVVTVTALRAGTGDQANTGNGITTTATGTNFTAAQVALTGGLDTVKTWFQF